MPTAPERGSRRKPSVAIKRDRRPSSGRRGYGRRWQKYAAGFLNNHPLCRTCERAGIIRAAEAVDHIVAIDGPADPLFWNTSNHQALCWSCHSRKTATENAR